MASPVLSFGDLEKLAAGPPPSGPPPANAPSSKKLTLADLDALAAGPGPAPKPQSFWDSFGKTVTTGSPLNPHNWGAMIKSAFDSPFSDENMAEAQRQAEIFKSGKAPALQPGEGEQMAGEGAGQLTNAALMALLTAGIMKGYGAASARAGVLADAIPDAGVLKGAIKNLAADPAVQDSTLGIVSPRAAAAVRLGRKILKAKTAAENALAPAAQATPAEATPALAPAPTAPQPSVVPAPGYSPRGEVVNPSSNLFPPIDRSQYFRPLTPNGAPAAAPAETVPAQAQPAAAPALEQEAPPANTADDDLVSALERSLELVKGRRNGAATAPVVSPANEGLNAQLQQKAAKTGVDMENAARMKKALKLGTWLQNGGISADDIDLMTPEHWKMAAEGAGVPWSKNPAKTIQTVKDLMRMGQSEPPGGTQ